LYYEEQKGKFYRGVVEKRPLTDNMELFTDLCWQEDERGPILA
jgi:hypothetical protein